MTKLEDLLSQRAALLKQTQALDVLIAVECRPVIGVYIQTYTANCTQAMAASLLTNVNRFLQDLGLPQIGHRELNAHMSSLGYVKVRKAAGIYYTLRRATDLSLSNSADTAA